MMLNRAIWHIIVPLSQRCRLEPLQKGVMHGFARSELCAHEGQLSWRRYLK